VEAQFGALEAGDAQAQMDALFPDTPGETATSESTEAAEPEASAEPEQQES
jgi:hypothetical protein